MSPARDAGGLACGHRSSFYVCVRESISEVRIELCRFTFRGRENDTLIVTFPVPFRAVCAQFEIRVNLHAVPPIKSSMDAVADGQHGVRVEISIGPVAALLAGLLVVVNVASALAIWWDKRRAARGQWRIREEILLIWALVGGWPAGTWAMRRFRHKTSSPSFIAKYVLALLLNLAGISVIAYAILT